MACKQLGIEIKTTSIPQKSKGRIEKNVPDITITPTQIELRLAGVTTLEQAK